MLLQRHYGSVGDLLREVIRQALSYPKEPIALLEDHLLEPSLSVNPIGLEEVIIIGNCPR